MRSVFRSVLLAVALSLLLAASPTHAVVYKCATGQGVVYQDAACPPGTELASLDQAAAAFSQGPYFTSIAAATRSHFTYFSFVTLTTTGYGDLTPATSLGRLLAIAEALLGQLYLVSVVALVVGNVARTQAERT